MKYEIIDNDIMLTDAETFDPEATLCSGQVFRFSRENDTWCIKSGREMAEICSITPKNYKISCTNANFFVNYFDFSTNYDNIITSLNEFNELNDCVKYGMGIRMMRQPLFEVIISFMISANNNIPRIRKSVEGICTRFGDKTEWGYAFPTKEQLLNATQQNFEELGCGYRAKYLVDTIKKLNETDLLDKLTNMTTTDAKKELLNLMGIGPKVADCILLFGLYRKDVFPVDTWIEKIYTQDYGGTLKNREKIADFFVDKYKDLSGYAQQFLFYYKRKNIKLA